MKPKLTAMRMVLALSVATATAACVASAASGGAKTAQGWTPAEQRAWYEATQGSRLMPLSWFLALERPGSTDRLADEKYLVETFNYLPSRSGRQPQLPVGFAVDDNDDSKLSYSKLRWYAGQGSRERWLGMNCSACHTADIDYNGQTVRIDGGAGLTDFQSFIETTDQALVETRDDPARFARFAARVLGKTRDNPRNRELLRGEMGKLIAWQEKTEQLNRAPVRYGFARLDAFGHIFNKIGMFVGADAPSVNPADAPVSYPFLWGIHLEDKLQWNGIAAPKTVKLGAGSLDVGALGRNTGEVIGVFGDVVVKRPSG
ncbi:MAG: di-heme-cytochrome C peroxidase, partial [Novosphingobium sp.]